MITTSQVRPRGGHRECANRERKMITHRWTSDTGQALIGDNFPRIE